VKRLSIITLSALILLASSGLSFAADDDSAPGYVMRFADIGHGQIVFTYEDDLWLVPDSGGDAQRITSHQGRETGAKFSPDGKQLAFTASYDGGTDVYVMDVGGGEPKRVTYHSGGSILLDWCPDGKAILFRANRIAPGYSDDFHCIELKLMVAWLKCYRWIVVPWLRLLRMEVDWPITELAVTLAPGNVTKVAWPRIFG